MRFYSLVVSLFFTMILVSLNSCDDNETIPDESPTGKRFLRGTSSFVFNEFAPLADKPTTVYYHVPEDITNNTKIVMAFHGGSRNASETRDELIALADKNQVILMVPEFSSENFPGGDGYNLGNVFVDGDNPSPSTLNDEGEWAFSLIEPLFDYVKVLAVNQTSTYHVYGFSAGGQFAHRFAFFKPNARIDKLVAASSGWYTMPDDQVDFPYGIKESPISTSSLPSIFSKQLTVLIGESDDNPNAGGLRRNASADVQGTNRLDRAIYFYNQSQDISSNIGATFNWQFVSLPNVSHELVETANYAFNTVFTN